MSMLRTVGIFFWQKVIKKKLNYLRHAKIYNLTKAVEGVKDGRENVTKTK